MILVTGASGFVGRHLVTYLISSGHEVVSLVRDNVKTKKESRVSPEADGHHVVIGDLNHNPEIPFNIDIMIHLAGQIILPGVKDEDFLRKNRNITEGLVNLLQHLTVKQVINLSTTSIYGNVLNGIATEDLVPHEPSAYAMSKLASEQALSQVNKDFSLTNIRTPGIIGPGANPNLVTKLAAQASTGSPIAVSNLGANFNNVVHISDLCKFVNHLLLVAPIEGSSSVNLASSKPITISDMTELILEFYKSRSRIIVKEPSTLPYVIDVQKLNKTYNFECLTVTQTISNFLNGVQ